MNSPKSAVVIAETRGAGDSFVITAIRPVPFQVHSGEDLVELLRACLKTIKGEAMVELAAAQGGHRVIKVAPQNLKKTLGCATDQKWRDRAGELFNPGGKRPNWSKGAAGAVSVAFKVAGELAGIPLQTAPERGCVQRTSRSGHETPGNLVISVRTGGSRVLRLVLRTQPRSGESASIRVHPWLKDFHV